MVDVTEATFEAEIVARSHEVPVIVDLWADWCGPCKAFAPTFAASADKHPDVVHAKVDTEAERFLEFERWWGGIFRMTGAEIEAIVENLFVGNKLARGEVKLASLVRVLREYLVEKPPCV